MELTLVEKSDSLKELLFKYKISALELAEILEIKTRKTVYLKLGNVEMFSIPELIKMSSFLNIEFIDICFLVKKEIDYKSEIQTKIDLKKLQTSLFKA